MPRPIVGEYLLLPIQDQLQVTRNEPHVYQGPLTPIEAESAWQAFKIAGAWNGPTVRLTATHANRWEVEPSDYRFWCLSHGLADRTWRDGEVSDEALSAMRKVQGLQQPRGWHDLLARPGWANTLGLMVFLRDATGAVCGALRSNLTVDGPGELAATVTGTVEPQDLDGSAPLEMACRRECIEEVGVMPDAVRIVALAACAPKWQPSLIAIGEVTKWFGQAADAWETERFVPLTSDGAGLSGLSAHVWPHVRDLCLDRVAPARPGI